MALEVLMCKTAVEMATYKHNTFIDLFAGHGGLSLGMVQTAKVRASKDKRFERKEGTLK